MINFMLSASTHIYGIHSYQQKYKLRSMNVSKGIATINVNGYE